MPTHTEALVPPKPNELVSARRLFVVQGWAVPLTRFKSQSGSSQFSVGGRRAECTASTVKMASTLPAAPSKWPTAPTTHRCYTQVLHTQQVAYCSYNTQVLHASITHPASGLLLLQHTGVTYKYYTPSKWPTAPTTHKCYIQILHTQQVTFCS